MSPFRVEKHTSSSGEIVKSDIIASGGITFLEEIKELKKNNIYGAIVGKAIYSGNLDLKEVMEVSR